MQKLQHYLKTHPLALLLLCLPLALLAEYGHWGSLWVFLLSAVGVIPMAEYIGESTEALAAYTSPRVGGLLNATLGNAAELIITIVAIREGLLELVKASITGSILGNLLLVLGMAFLLGGLKNGLQTFEQRNATRNAILLVLAVLALLIPSVLSHAIGPEGSPQVETLSLGVAGVMIVLYALALIYGFRAQGMPLAHQPSDGDVVHEPDWSIRKAVLVLAASTIGVVVLSELLVGAVEAVVAGFGVSEFFLGVILIPVVGNVAEHLVAVEVALANKMELSVEIAIASSLQIALFVAPVLVFISLAMGNPLQLIFNQFELLALIAGVLVVALVSADGESNWLEGAELLAVYIILGLAFFLLPG
ncbi:MAG: calcium/proton exchanger [Anaerolineae bacterium]|nr:MAG: calcium/proton exchanger [Anaerolineae bacterium]